MPNELLSHSTIKLPLSSVFDANHGSFNYNVDKWALQGESHHGLVPIEYKSVET